MTTSNSRRVCFLGRIAFAAVAVGLPACFGFAQTPSPEESPLPEVRRFADNLIEHARDRFGPTQTPLLVCQLEIDGKKLPPADSRLFASSHRGGAGPLMNNLQFDSAALRLLYALTKVTGEKRYAEEADRYLRFYLEKLPEPETGFFPWGDHRGYDVTREETIRAQHEFKLTWPVWEQMYGINPKAVTREIEGLRRHIIDPSRSYGFNRHCPPGRSPHSMNSSAGAYIAAWAFLYTKTGRPEYLEWAEGMADYLWSLRGPKTDLLAAHPRDPAYPESGKSGRSKARADRTEYMGPMNWYAANLLRTSLLLGPEKGAKFRRQALAYQRAFLSRMDIQPDGSYYASFDLATGRPLFDRITEGWQHLPQSGGPISWANGVIGVRASFSVAFACKVTREPDLRAAFDRLLPMVRLDRFERLDGEPQPISAGLLSQVMVGFLNMYQASGEKRYLDQAALLSRYAMAHFYTDGWFVCGLPTVVRYRDPKLNVWRMYCNRGGSDDLALAVLRVHLARTGQEDPVDDDPFCCF